MYIMSKNIHSGNWLDLFTSFSMGPSGLAPETVDDNPGSIG